MTREPPHRLRGGPGGRAIIRRRRDSSSIWSSVTDHPLPSEVAMNTLPDTRARPLGDVATRLRIVSISATTIAGSGHRTSSASAADLVAAIFFAAMRLDPDDPCAPASDGFVLSKGHAAPVLYAAWAEMGVLKREELGTLRGLTSDLEGHPTPPFALRRRCDRLARPGARRRRGPRAGAPAGPAPPRASSCSRRTARPPRHRWGKRRCSPRTGGSRTSSPSST